MATNFPGPFQVRIFYSVTTSDTQNHVMAVNCDCPTVTGSPGDAFDQWIPLERGGGAVNTLLFHTNALVNIFRPMFNSSMTVVRAELWKYTAGTFDAAWQSTESYAAAGTGTRAPVANREQIYSYRTTNGGHMRVHTMECGLNAGPTQQLPLTATDTDAFADYFLLSTSPWLARDNGYPIAFLGMHPGENERLFKKRNRA